MARNIEDRDLEKVSGAGDPVDVAPVDDERDTPVRKPDGSGITDPDSDADSGDGTVDINQG